MYQALYRKWRPQSFSDVVGQPAITDTIKAQVASNRLSHAYLFAGSRGTGKTSCAKILSKAVNCENPINGDPCNECSACRGITSGAILDVVEIDAASNNGVDHVRELRDEAIYSPASAKKRVYIIDEVHMFSNSAFNALLKILEEPPEHVLFILATTELHKVPATILSRCQRFTFKRIDSSDISARILYIAQNEGISIEKDAADFIARLADGGLRDALSIFDQCAAYGHANITRETVEDVVGLAGSSAICELVDSFIKRDTATALLQLSDLYNGGRDLISVLSELSSYLRDLLVEKVAPGTKLNRMNSALDATTFEHQMRDFTENSLISMISTISETLSTIGSSANKRIDAELCIIKLCSENMNTDETALLQRIEAIESKLEKGGIQPVVKRQISTEKPVVNSVDNVENSHDSKEKLTCESLKECPPTTDNNCETINWLSVVEAAKSELSPGIVPLLRGFEARQNGNQILLSSDNELAKNILNHREQVAVLERAAERICGKKVVIRMADEKGITQSSDQMEFDSLCDKLKNIPNVTIIP